MCSSTTPTRLCQDTPIKVPKDLHPQNQWPSLHSSWPLSGTWPRSERILPERKLFLGLQETTLFSSHLTNCSLSVLGWALLTLDRKHRSAQSLDPACLGGPSVLMMLMVVSLIMTSKWTSSTSGLRPRVVYPTGSLISSQGCPIGRKGKGFQSK